MSGTRERTAPPKPTSLLAAVLTCEAVVIGLAIPVAVAVQGVDGRTAGLLCGGLAAACLLLAGLVRRRWAVAVGSALQIALIASGFMVSTMFFLGVLFGALWLTSLWLGRKVQENGTR
ncbi:DUF4233 domain-containing protein [Thermomonospora catenispora]|uniref:DUF4233 domain-containing protein n=1 Tax=Thermomonospora catenispora TaxID=2493090 RepID=UPI0011217564|nr:DUF4233 domain-containing protein [Thermomonospora catenispora]TNY34573.1 DUF4233 domain-containing protein [Thermomonospora catenispora]